jgi:hypothetical protein
MSEAKLPIQAEPGQSETGSLFDGMTSDQTTRMLEIKENNVLFQEQVKALDQKLISAKQVSIHLRLIGLQPGCLTKCLLCQSC